MHRLLLMIFEKNTRGGLLIDGFKTAVVIVTSKELQRNFSAISS